MSVFKIGFLLRCYPYGTGEWTSSGVATPRYPLATPLYDE